MRAPRLVIVLTLVAAACSPPAAAPAGSSAASAPPAGASSTNGTSASAESSVSTGSQPAPGGTAIEACTLLTDDEILEVTDHPAISSTAGNVQGIFANGCEWEVESDMGFPAEIVLGVVEPGGKAYWEQYFAPFVEENGDKPIENLGDVAVEQEPDSVMVVVGDTLVSLQYVGVGPGGSEKALELTRKVVARLGGQPLRRSARRPRRAAASPRSAPRTSASGDGCVP